MKFTLFGFLLLPVVCMSQDLTWPDPVANHVVPRQSTVVTHGPVLGDALAWPWLGLGLATGWPWVGDGSDMAWPCLVMTQLWLGHG